MSGFRAREIVECTSIIVQSRDHSQQIKSEKGFFGEYEICEWLVYTKSRYEVAALRSLVSIFLLAARTISSLLLLNSSERSVLFCDQPVFVEASFPVWTSLVPGSSALVTILEDRLYLLIRSGRGAFVTGWRLEDEV